MSGAPGRPEQTRIAAAGAGTPAYTEAFHAGEQAMQARVGVRARLAEVGSRVIRDAMPDQHRDFFAQLPFVVVGSIDGDGQPWASVLTGAPGFMRSPDPSRLRIAALPFAHDPLHATLVEGATIGLLGIEPHTRRRNRMNGDVAALHAGGFSVVVRQSFGNCPKYIHPRHASFDAAAARPGPVLASGALDAAARRIIAEADTIFMASASSPAPAASADRSQGVDVSHRGGPQGFVQIDDDILTVPDFAGNLFFNTLGNLAVHPQAGLLFIDFARGDLLYVAARAEIVWDGPAVAAVPGAQRLLRLHVEQVRRVERAAPLRWDVV